MEEQLRSILAEMEDLESRVREIEMTLAGDKVWKESLKSDVEKIQNNGTWILRLIIGGIVMYLLTQMLKGGLVV